LLIALKPFAARQLDLPPALHAPSSDHLGIDKEFIGIACPPRLMCVERNDVQAGSETADDCMAAR
jgi:hypothetical protein